MDTKRFINNIYCSILQKGLYPRGPGRAVRRALVAYEVWGSTPLFVCSRSLGESLPPGAGISLGEAWDIWFTPKKKKILQRKEPFRLQYHARKGPKRKESIVCLQYYLGRRRLFFYSAQLDHWFRLYCEYSWVNFFLNIKIIFRCC
jgi:hypothetical protein